MRVHRDGEGFVRFFADGAVGHGSGREALHDLFGRLDFLDRHGLGPGLNFIRPRSVQSCRLCLLMSSVNSLNVAKLSAARRAAASDRQRVQQVIFAARHDIE